MEVVGVWEREWQVWVRLVGWGEERLFRLWGVEIVIMVTLGIEPYALECEATLGSSVCADRARR